jgi:RNA polymerase sporulation-specific sigma factor
MHLRKTASQKAEVSLDEPLNTDWDGNELLLGEVLGTDGDMIFRPLEDDADRLLLRRAITKLSVRERDIITLRFGWPKPGTDSKGGGRQHGHIPVLHIEA